MVIILTKFIAHKPEKEVISMRISTDVLKTVDDKAAKIGISRNELINQMIQYALDNMDEDEQ
ncbi:MAG: CopG family transcriptional regulator [Oscillospiraceae bacterium]|nr:CopG family transcriptional regulator [Oscillospiraceae bacterium]